LVLRDEPGRWRLGLDLAVHGDRLVRDERQVAVEVEGHDAGVDGQTVDVEIRDLVAVGRPLGREALAVGRLVLIVDDNE